MHEHEHEAASLDRLARARPDVRSGELFGLAALLGAAHARGELVTACDLVWLLELVRARGVTAGSPTRRRPPAPAPPSHR